jgi:predicted AAA+ superfamily ATPase
MANYTDRKQYINKLLSYKDKDLIKVVTGVRRAGKSTLLLQFQDLLKEEDANVIAFN